MKNELTVYGDGGSRGNPGEAAYGFVILKDDEIIFKEGKRIGIDTNNVAEYSAVVNALKWIVENMPKVSKIHFFLDSLLVASQMEGLWKIKHPKMRELFITAKQLEAKLQAEIIYTQVPRSKNTQADKLVNEALDYKI